MKQVIVAVRDRAVDAFLRPFAAPSVGAAIRSFSDEINRNAPDNQMANHPEDYDLYQLAEWDENTGIFTENKPRQIAIGKDTKLKQGA